MSAVVEAAFDKPNPSVTVRVTVKCPLALYVCIGVAPLAAAELSPKFQEKVSGLPLGSLEAVPLKLTAVPAVPEYGPPGLATGGFGRLNNAVAACTPVCTVTVRAPIVPGAI